MFNKRSRKKKIVDEPTIDQTQMIAEGPAIDGVTDAEVASEAAELMTEAPASEIISDPVTDEQIAEDVVERLEATEGATDEPSAAPDVAEATPETPEVPQSFDEALKAITDEDADVMMAKITAAIDERAAFETAKDPSNGNIHRTLKKARKELTLTRHPARVLIVTNVDPEVFNRTIHENSRYNVYAIGKFADLVHALDTKLVANAINNACMRSLFQFRAAGMTFTGEMAKCAASDKIRIERAVNDHLVRHTVSASTAPTQSSSTMQAAETLGLVTRSGSGKNPVFTLTANAVVGKLQEVLGIPTAVAA